MIKNRKYSQGKKNIILLAHFKNISNTLINEAFNLNENINCFEVISKELKYSINFKTY